MTDFDMEDDLKMTVPIWEMRVSIWEMTLSICDGLSLCLGETELAGDPERGHACVVDGVGVCEKKCIWTRRRVSGLI